MTRLTSTLALGAALALALSGCTGNDAKKDEAPPPAAPTTQAPQASPLPNPPDLGPNKKGVVADVKITACPTDKGQMEAKGTAVNSADQKRDMTVIVVWLKNDSGQPLGSGMAVLRGVDPKKTVEWTVKADVVDKADRCVLNAQAGQIK